MAMSFVIFKNGTVPPAALLCPSIAPPKALIWFYSDNDIQENKFFHDRSGHWKPKLRAVDYQAKSAFGGRAHEPINFLPYTRRFWPILFRSVTSKPKPAPIEKVTRRYDNLEARYFIYALLQNAAKLRNVPILVLEVDGWNKNDSNFLSAVEHFKKKKVDELQEKGIELTLLDISTKLKAEHYYFYDDHMNSKGQAEIAKLLEPWVASKVNGK